MGFKNKNQEQNKESPITEPDVQNIIISIKTKVYLEDSEVLEKRLDHIKQLFEQYSVPDLSIEYPILKIWPFKLFCTFFVKVFRKLHYLHSQSQREAFLLLLDEFRSFQVTVQHIHKLQKPQPPEKVYDE